MSRTIRIIATAAVACLLSWAGLWFGAGWVGLSRSVSIGPLTLLTEQSLALLACALGASVPALLFGRAQPTSVVVAAVILGGVLLADLVAAFVLGPEAIGELTPEQGPQAFVVLTGLGAQILGVTAGLGGGRLLRR